jgi:hypothetical protein
MGKPPIKKKYIETPEIMWELFQAYTKEVKSDPFLVKDWVGKDGDEVKREKEKPLTLEGFELYCYNNEIVNDLGDYFSNRNDNYNSYSPICMRIRKAIRADQIEGGMAGIYNPSITQRLNGLVEKQETTFTMEQPLFPDENKEIQS